jgi:hypothetical protein
MSGYLDEYLVRLGVSTDDAGLAKLTNALKGIGDTVAAEEATFASLITTVLKFQVEATTAVLAVAGAVGKMAEDVAVADQEYRLFGLTMFMNADAAKKLKITLDVLGQPLGMIAWDAELQRRAARLIGLQNIMQRGMTVNGDEADFMKIRDVRNELAALEVEWIYFKQSLTAGLAKAFAPEMDMLLQKLTDFNNWFVKNLPEITAKAVEFLEPILKAMKPLGKDLIALFKELGVAFTQLMAAWDNDRSLDGNTFSFEKFGKAVQQAATQLTEFLDDLVKIETWMLRHKGFLAGAAAGMKTKNPELAVAEMAAGMAYDEAQIQPAKGEGMPAEWQGWGPELDNLFNKWHPVGGASAQWGRLFGHLGGKNTFETGLDTSATSGGTDVKAEADRVSKLTGVPANLLWDQWAHETGGFKSVAAPNNLAGIRLPGSTEYRKFGSLDEFGDYYAKLVSRYPDLSRATTPDSFASVLKGHRYYEDSQRNYSAGLSRWDSAYKGKPSAAHVSVAVGDIHVHMPPGSDGKEVVKTVSGTIMRNTLQAQAQAVYA